jgi:hypothetical protein
LAVNQFRLLNKKRLPFVEGVFFVGVRRFLGRRKVFPAVGYLQFPFLRRKRYPIPAQNGVTEASERIGQRFPAQAATI